MEGLDAGALGEVCADRSPEPAGEREPEYDVGSIFRGRQADCTANLGGRQHVFPVQSSPRLNLVLHEQPARELGFGGSKAVPDKACEGSHGADVKRELLQGSGMELAAPLGAAGEGAGVVAIGETDRGQHGQARS
jgi:hypothetical protein